jgi:hypothetical protein
LPVDPVTNTHSVTPRLYASRAEPGEGARRGAERMGAHERDHQRARMPRAANLLGMAQDRSPGAEDGDFVEIAPELTTEP